MNPGLKKGSGPPPRTATAHLVVGWSPYCLGSLILFSLGSQTVSELTRWEGGNA